MVPNKDENCIVKISFVRGGLDEFLEAVIRISKAVEFIYRLKAILTESIGQHLCFLETAIFLGNHEGSVVVCCLDYCEKWLRFILQPFISFQEEIFITDTPDV